jgi:hypothetical protein
MRNRPRFAKLITVIGSIVEVIQEPLQRLKSIRVTIENATGLPMLVREAFWVGLLHT